MIVPAYLDDGAHAGERLSLGVNFTKHDTGGKCRGSCCDQQEQHDFVHDCHCSCCHCAAAIQRAESKQKRTAHISRHGFKAYAASMRHHTGSIPSRTSRPKLPAADALSVHPITSLNLSNTMRLTTKRSAHLFRSIAEGSDCKDRVEYS